MKSPRKKQKNKSKKASGIQELELEELKAIIQKSGKSALAESERNKLDAAMNTLAFITQELQAKDASILRLRKFIFGSATEKTKNVFPKEPAKATDGELAEIKANDGSSDTTLATKDETKKIAKGHGRNSVETYRQAEKIKVSHKTLKAKDDCPDCDKGKLYRQTKPAVLVRIVGVAPLSAKVYELERFRCNLCGKILTAETPAGIGSTKYDESASTMIALLKYGCGLPFHRLNRLQKDLGIPLPASTQWEIVEKAADLITPAHKELIRQAAQGEVIHNDDTVMKILNLASTLALEDSKGRQGIYSSGIVSIAEGRRIAVFFTGNQHAGENLEDLLKQRQEDLPLPIQMCDALSHNTKGEFETIVANCIAHARRKFVDIKVAFPDETLHVLEVFKEVYHNDAFARENNLTAEERLNFHQEKSEPAMAGLAVWMAKKIDERLVEPNSVLGEAIRYVQKHWSKLTLFLREAGAPLDNNICERALKKAILHRKNALFYKTKNGARVGDLFMSLIHTVELCEEDPFEYLNALQKNHQVMAKKPEAWMPWNFREALAVVGGDEESFGSEVKSLRS